MEKSFIRLFITPFIILISILIFTNCGREIVTGTNPEFIELARPPQMYGQYHKSIGSMVYYARWYMGYSNGGESYEDLRNRINAAKTHFKQYPEDARVAVVTHSVFINLSDFP